MSIWTSSKVILGLAAGLGLAACSQEAGTFSLLEQPSSSQETKSARKNVALREAGMVRGAISLQPPPGFCVDKRALRQNFAVLARCDSLGDTKSPSDAPLGMIAVSVAAVSDAPLDPAIWRNAVLQNGGELISQTSVDGVTLLQMRGGTPEGTDPMHWRALTQIGAYDVNMSAFAPPGGTVTQKRGAQLLLELAQRSQNDTVAQDVAGAAKPAQKDRSKRLGGFLNGLFD